MKYLCLIYTERSQMLEFLPPGVAQTHVKEYMEFAAQHRKSGLIVGGNRLLPPDSAVTVRVRNGIASTTDGPYAETKEQLGGYFLIDAADLNEAVRLASGVPGARFGAVEVRPVAEGPQCSGSPHALEPAATAAH